MKNLADHKMCIPYPPPSLRKRTLPMLWVMPLPLQPPVKARSQVYWTPETGTVEQCSGTVWSPLSDTQLSTFFFSF